MAGSGFGLGPFDAWTAFSAQARFIIDCHAIIMLRLIRIAGGGEVAACESVRMITDKMETLAGAQAAAAAMPRHGLHGAVVAAQRRYRRIVARNRRRPSAA